MRDGRRQFLLRRPQLLTWRALTDNDRGADSGFVHAQWFGAGRYARPVDHVIDVDAGSGDLVGVYRYELAEPGRAQVTMRMRVDGNADLWLDLDYEAGQDGPDLPLFGIEWRLPVQYANLRFYGPGPAETYADRQLAPLGIWSTDAYRDLAPYLVPQETGQHLHTRWAEVTDGDGHGLRIDAVDGDFACSLLPVSTLMLEEGLHQDELPASRHMFLRMLAVQEGVGGDDSWGAPVHERYRVPASRPQHLGVRITMI